MDFPLFLEMENSMRISGNNDNNDNNKDNEKSTTQGISANSFSILLREFEDFVASSENSTCTSSPNPHSTINHPHLKNLTTISQLPKKQPPFSNRRQYLNSLKNRHQYNRFGKNRFRTTMLRWQNSTAKRNIPSYKYASSRLTKVSSPSSTHSSPTNSSSNSSSPSSGSPILHNSPVQQPSSHIPSPSSNNSIPPSIISHPVMPIDVKKPTAVNCNKLNTANLASKRDPLTNKIIIKQVVKIQLQKDEVSKPGKSTPVIYNAPAMSSLLPPKSLLIKSRPLSRVKSSPSPSPSVSPVPFPLPPLSVRRVEPENQDHLPELLKPKNLAKYVEASAPKPKKKMSAEKFRQSAAILLDHDYSRSSGKKESEGKEPEIKEPEMKEPEKKSKRTFFIPKKKSIPKNKSILKNGDNLEVVDMECSDTENDGIIVVEENPRENDKTGLKGTESPSPNGPAMLYGYEEFYKGLKLIDEEAERRFSDGYVCEEKKHQSPVSQWPSSHWPGSQWPGFRWPGSQSYMIDPVPCCKYIDDDEVIPAPQDAEGWEKKESCVNEKDPNPQVSTASHLSEENKEMVGKMESCVNEQGPDLQVSTASHLSEENKETKLVGNQEAVAGSEEKILVAIDPLDNLTKEDQGFSLLPNLTENSECPVDLDDILLDPLDVKEEIVEFCVLRESETPVQEEICIDEFVGQEKLSMGVEKPVVESGVQYVSLLSSMPQQTSPETSDTGCTSDESKENIVDKVPAYLMTPGRLGTTKNVLQRWNIKQDSATVPETCRTYPFDSDRKKNGRSPSLYESGSSSECSSASSSYSARSPSPDYVRHSRTSYPTYRESRSRRSAHRPRYPSSYSRSRSRSRSRSPVYSRSQISRSHHQRNADENRRVVYVGKLPCNFTERQLKDLFKCYGKIEKVSLHFRSEKDNYGFVSFHDKEDATRCLEMTNEIPNFPFEVCYGGRREFCKVEYSDLDGIAERQEEYGHVFYKKRDEGFVFDRLLKQCIKKRKL